MVKRAFGKIMGFFLTSAAVICFTSCSGSESGENVTGVVQNKAEAAFKHSVISDSGFENSLLGIGVKLDEEWRFANSEELATANGLEEITDESLAEALKTKTFICDMMAEKKFKGGADSITLTFPNISSASGDMTEREYAEATLVGIENATAVIETVRLGDNEHISIRLIGKISDTDYYQRMIFVKKNGYLGMITLTCVSEDEIYDIISRFYTL